MTTEFNVNKYTTEINGLRFSDTNYSATLKANTELEMTVPATSAIGVTMATKVNKFIAIIRVTYNDDVWFAVNGTAAVPVGAAFAATTSILLSDSNPLVMLVNAGDTLGFISTATAGVSIAFYSVQEA